MLKFIKNNKLSIITVFLISMFYTSVQAKSGEEIFNTNCKACHTTTNVKGVGPGLGNVDDRRTDEWIKKWVKNSSELIASGDKDAVAIFEEFNKMPMPPFAQLSDEEILSVVDFLDTPANASTTETATSTVSNGSENRNIIFWALLAILSIIAFFAFKKKHGEDFWAKNAEFEEPHAVQNFAMTLFLFIVAAGVIITLLVFALQSNYGNIKHFMFSVFPYLALGIFIIGSLYRYNQKGFKVSSLSTQFLEGNQLFWGSQPFHWGLFILFFGHLTALLFPSSVLAWNGMPVRLLILETTAFIFGLSALLGISLLIVRRFRHKKLLVVTNKMDMLVYAVLLTQIITGLGVAFYVRWGSSWFASVLTPYLRSVFVFNPEAQAVSAAPVLVQLHIISAFLIIAIIPFTRFMHFLVYPLNYYWRSFQQVIWNWNRKDIRQSKKHTYGKKPRNH